jgi:hypothetical protein
MSAVHSGKSTQQLFFETLEQRLPKEFSLNVDYSFANRGVLRIFRAGTFDVVLALWFGFETDYASFNVPGREGPLPLIGDRAGGTSFPSVKFHEIESRVLSSIFKQLGA